MTENTIEPTDEEERAIRSLKRVAKTWPKTLWLYSASGSLCVMKKNADGERAVVKDSRGDGVDQNYCVDAINIENDGGEW